MLGYRERTESWGSEIQQSLPPRMVDMVRYSGKTSQEFRKLCTVTLDCHVTIVMNSGSQLESIGIGISVSMSNVMSSGLSIFQNLSKIVKIIKNGQNCQKISKIVKMCQNMSKFFRIVNIVKKNQKISKYSSQNVVLKMYFSKCSCQNIFLQVYF